ncbi:MAG: hypothetical protein ACLQAT_07040 [Candidatus Binataceae bacterium]
MKRGGRPTILALAALAIALATIARPPSARAEDNLMLNGDLSKGAADQPDDWRTEAWVNEPDAFTYTWAHPDKRVPGQLEVDALKPNDARWMQSLTLPPGWYYFSAEVRTENVGTQATGASISIMEDGAMSPDIRGTTGWQRVGFYLQIGGHGADVEVALRVGGFGSLNVGKAFFRDIHAVKLAAPPPDATPVYDLTAIRKADEPEPIGHPITLIATFLVLALIAVYGWRMFGVEDPPPVIIERAPAPKVKARSKARR